jgi:hypothetical protein
VWTTRPHGKSRGICIHDKAGHPISTLVVGRSRKHQAILSFVGTTNPKLAAVDDPVIAVLHRLGLNGSGRAGSEPPEGSDKPKKPFFSPRRVTHHFTKPMWAIHFLGLAFLVTICTDVIAEWSSY